MADVRGRSEAKSPPTNDVQTSFDHVTISVGDSERFHHTSGLDGDPLVLLGVCSEWEFPLNEQEERQSITSLKKLFEPATSMRRT